mmetsp:Transcript_24977/g.63017  ORF Transcript_24977/g.63017 Transcript_24977/m.63017 type:complete len:341 (-) Transcript_24977:571-1593(-)
MLLSSSRLTAAVLIGLAGAAAAAAGFSDGALSGAAAAAAAMGSPVTEAALTAPESSSRENQRPRAFLSSGLVMAPLPSWSALVKTHSTSASSGSTPSLRSVRRDLSCGLSSESEASVSYFANMASISSLLSLYAIHTSTAATKSSGRTDDSNRSSFFLNVPTRTFSFCAMTCTQCVSSSVAFSPAEMSLSQFCSSSNDSAPVPLLSHLSSVSLMNCLCCFLFWTISFLRVLWLALLDGTTLITLVVVILSLGFSIVGSLASWSPARAYHSESALESSGGVMTPLPRVSLVESTQSTSLSGTSSPSLRAVRSSFSCGLSRYAEWSLSNFLNMASISSLEST